MTRHHHRLIGAAAALVAALLFLIALAATASAAPEGDTYAPPAGANAYLVAPAGKGLAVEPRGSGWFVSLVGIAPAAVRPPAGAALVPVTSRGLTVVCASGAQPLLTIHGAQMGRRYPSAIRAFCPAAKAQKASRLALPRAYSISPSGALWRCPSAQLALIVRRTDTRVLTARCEARLIPPVAAAFPAGASILPMGGAWLWCRDLGTRAVWSWPAGEAPVVALACQAAPR